MKQPRRSAAARRAAARSSGMHRRDLLRVTAAAAGAAAVAPACVTAGGPREIPAAPPKAPLDPDTPLRLGILGVGGMGGGHLNAFLTAAENGSEKLEMVALADVNAAWLGDKLKTVEERQGKPAEGYADYRELLARDDIDGVLIASPEHWHARMAVDAIAAGKDVYVEKPMTLRLADALWLQDVMTANPHMRLQVGTQYMMYERYRAARRLIAEGAIGHPTFSQTSYCRNSRDGEWLYGIDERVVPGETLDWEAWCGELGPREWDPAVYHRWRRYRDYSTGIVGDLLVHMMTPLIYAVDAGWPVRVTATGGHYLDREMENHDQVNLTVQFENEHTMVVAGSTCNEQGLEVMVRGHEANLFLGGTHCVLRPERLFVDDIDEETVQCPDVSPQDELRLNWMRSIRTREQNVSQVELAAKVMVVVDLATRSMWEGSAFAFDPTTREARAV